MSIASGTAYADGSTGKIDVYTGNAPKGTAGNISISVGSSGGGDGGSIRVRGRKYKRYR